MKTQVRLAFWILVACSVLIPVKVSSAADIDPSIVSEVTHLLDLMGAGDKDAAEKIYSMGPEIDPILLQEFAKADASSRNEASRLTDDLTAILLSRNYEKELREILKRRLQDEDPKQRISAAIILGRIYRYFSVKDLAAVVSGKRAVSFLDDKLFYESVLTGPEIKDQVVEILRSDSEVSKDFTVAFLKSVFGLDCSSCGIDPKKWESLLESTKELDFLNWEQSGFGDIEDGQPTMILSLISSSDGKTIAFVPRLDSNGKSDCNLWVMDTRTKKIARILVPGNCFHPSWSPSGDLIAFEYATSKGFDIATIDKDGADFFVWTRTFSSTLNQRPKWFPDLNKLAYLRQFYINTLMGEIWEIDIDANKTVRLARDNHCASIRRLYDVWFPSKNDDLCILDCFGRDKATEGLYRVSPDSSYESQFVHPLDFASFDWIVRPSPDENMLAYPSCGKLCVLDLSSGEKREFETGTIGYLFWTSDGRKIVYHKTGKFESKVCCISLETGEITVLTDGYISWQALGPDGDSIYYVKNQAENPSIWRIDLDGGNDTKIFPVDGIEYTSVHAQPVLR